MAEQIGWFPGLKEMQRILLGSLFETQQTSCRQQLCKTEHLRVDSPFFSAIIISAYIAVSSVFSLVSRRMLCPPPPNSEIPIRLTGVQPQNSCQKTLILQFITPRMLRVIGPNLE